METVDMVTNRLSFVNTQSGKSNSITFEALIHVCVEMREVSNENWKEKLQIFEK